MQVNSIQFKYSRTNPLRVARLTRPCGAKPLHRAAASQERVPNAEAQTRYVAHYGAPITQEDPLTLPAGS